MGVEKATPNGSGTVVLYHGNQFLKYGSETIFAFVKISFPTAVGGWKTSKNTEIFSDNWNFYPKIDFRGVILSSIAIINKKWYNREG